MDVHKPFVVVRIASAKWNPHLFIPNMRNSAGQKNDKKGGVKWVSGHFQATFLPTQALFQRYLDYHVSTFFSQITENKNQSLFENCQYTQAEGFLPLSSTIFHCSQTEFLQKLLAGGQKSVLLGPTSIFKQALILRTYH